MQGTTDHTRAHTRIARLYRLDQLSCMQGTRPQKMQWLRDASACACREDGGRGCTLGPLKRFPVITHVLSWIKSFEYPAAAGQRTASDSHPSWGSRGVLLLCLSPGCKEQKHMLVEVQNVLSVQHLLSRLALRCTSVFVECVAETVHAQQRECTTEIVRCRTELLSLLQW